MLRPFDLYCASYSAQRFQRGCSQGGRWTELLITLRTGSLATTAYCPHCPKVEIAFCGVWYLLGLLLLTGIGALIGPRVLRRSSI